MHTRYVRKINENGLTARRSYPDHRQVGDLWLCPRYVTILRTYEHLNVVAIDDDFFAFELFSLCMFNV